MRRFHLDEHVAHAVDHGLRQRQIDVTTTTDAGLLSATDEDHLEFALRENRVVFTNDSDFLRLAADGRHHAGIVFCPPEASSIGEVVRYLALMHDCLTSDEVANRIEYL